MRVPNGIFTLFRGDEWRTFKIRSQKADARFKPGERILYALCGPRNMDDYRGIGTIDERGLVIWFKWRGTPTAAFAQMFWERMAEDKHLEWSVEEARTCLVCNRLLTTPASVLSGIGPECADRGAPPKANAVAVLLARKARLEARLVECQAPGLPW